MRRLDAVIWDLDGTLIDSKLAHPAAHIAAIKSVGGPHYEPEDVIACYPLGPVTAILTKLLGRPCTQDDVDRYHEELEIRASLATVYPGVEDALATVSNADVPQLLFTGGSTIAAEMLLGGLGLLKYLAVIVGGDQVKNPKPAPDGILRACELAHTKPTACVYVGDHPYDLQAARAAGATAIAAAWGHMFDSADAMRYADFVAQNPGDVITFVGL